ncbi:hypothetical protein DIPPA_32564 [Diplonema papillatum]|nr:hypothetical protein DIPPA_32564 [Diplonema papillatum]
MESEWQRLPESIRKELYERSATLRYRYTIQIKLSLTKDSQRIGLLPMYDGKGSIRSFGSFTSMVSDKLREMGVDPDSFLSARPIIYCMSWRNIEIPCGGLIEHDFAEVIKSLMEDAKTESVQVSLTFVSSEAKMRPIPLNTDLDFSFTASPGTGIVVAELPSDSLLATLKEVPAPPDEPAPKYVTVKEGTRIVSINDMRVSTQCPTESFKALFQRRMYRPGDKVMNTYALGIQTPLFVDQNPPDIFLLYKQCLDEALILYIKAQDKTYTSIFDRWQKNGSISYQTMHEKMKEAIASASEPEGFVENKEVARWCMQVLHSGVAEYVEKGGLDRDVRLPFAASKPFFELRAARRVTRRSCDSARRNLHADMKLLVNRLRNGGSVLSYAVRSEALWGPLHPCPVCDAVHEPGSDFRSLHPGLTVVYGTVYNVDIAKVAPVSHFLTQFGFESWRHVEVVYPLTMMLDRIQHLQGTAVDVRFRAVLDDSQLADYTRTADALQPEEKRHFMWDTTGRSIRKPWSTGREAVRSKKRKIVEV